jgi:phosphoribosylformylglycinamidine cyclo-ligase
MTHGPASYRDAGVDYEAIVECAAGLGLQAWVAGSVEEGPREVVLEPVDIRFAGGELELSDAASQTADLEGIPHDQ